MQTLSGLGKCPYFKTHSVKFEFVIIEAAHKGLTAFICCRSGEVITRGTNLSAPNVRVEVTV